MEKVYVVSLGCSKNLVDAEIMMALLQREGWDLTNQPENAEVIIVNTCTFIEAAKEESIETVLRAAQYKEQGRCRLLAVTGCLSQQYQEELVKEIPEIDIILGTSSWERIVEAIKEAEKKSHVAHFDAPYVPDFSVLPRLRTTPSYSAYLKIAEGCNNGCTFCIIPYVRGRFRSRSPESIMEEVRVMAEEGVREINIIAQDTTSYGRDLPNSVTLTDLLKKLNAVEGIEWIRLLYLYPKNFNDELLDFIVTNDKVCKYIDIPLQHISDRILRQMNRRDRKEGILALLRKIRAQKEYITLRSTFIVGFPGETDEDFRELCDLVRTIRFDRLGVFMYSREEGTPAAKMAEQVPQEIKEERYHTLMAIQAEISEQLNKEAIGRQETALVENIIHNEQGVVAEGRLKSQAPEVDGSVFIENGAFLYPGDFVPVRIAAGYAYDLVAVCDGEAW